MKATRTLVPWAIGLTLALRGFEAHGADPPAEPRPTSRDLPAFVAPAKPPADPSAAPEEPAVVEPQGPLTLRDAWALALLHSPDLSAFSWEMRASEARTLQAKKPLNPELEIRLTRLGATDQESALEDVSRRLVLRQEFELGGKRARRVDLARAERDLAEWDYQTKRNEVATLVAGRFVALLGAQRRVESHARSVEFCEHTSNQVSKLVETGAVRGLEIHRSRREVALARIELQDAEAERDAARFKLASAWGNRSPRFTEAVGDLELITPLPDIEVILDLARWSPAVGRSDTDLSRSWAALSLAKADRVPDLTVGGGVRWDDNLDGRDYLVEFQFDLPLFDRKQGDVLEGRTNVAKARAERGAAEAASVEAISEVYYLARAAGARAAVLRDEVLPAARATVDGVRLGFQTNTETPDNFFDARRELTRAEVDYTEALVEYQQLLAVLEGLLGQAIPD